MSWIEAFCGELDIRPTASEVLGWDSLRVLARAGVTLGAHTRTHPLMHRISIEDAIAEAVESKRDLEREIGSILPVLAYPGGGLNEAVVNGVRDAGFQLAFTTLRGVNDLQQADRLKLRRINVGQKTSFGVFRAQLTPWMAFLQ
jgi:peptidoglycan/xylan/chitin deacetylase (PgdA/CDA1 family)